MREEYEKKKESRECGNAFAKTKLDFHFTEGQSAYGLSKWREVGRV